MRRFSVLLVALMVAGLILPANAFAAIRIQKIFFDPPGSDTGSNSSLKKEYVVIKNTGGKKKSLKGWTLRDTENHVYKFDSTFKLGAGKVVRVRTGSGSDKAHDVFQDSGAYIWNNDGDTAKLKKGAKVKDKCTYSSSASSPVAC